MSKFDSIIFDLDGTLWDCSELCAKAFNSAYKLANMDKRVDGQFVRSISGRPSAECDALLLEGVPERLKQKVQEDFDNFEISTIIKEGSQSLYSGVNVGLSRLKERYKLFVVSNCGEEYLKAFLNCSGVGENFIDSLCFGQTKLPKHKNIIEIIRKHRLNSSCYLGDTVGDEEAALKANCHFFHAAYGFGVTLGKHTAFSDFSGVVDFFLDDV
jgi:phosphoglycolate phosphatase